MKALAICPSREEFVSLYGNGMRRGHVAEVRAAYPSFTEHDVKMLALHWGVLRTRGGVIYSANGPVEEQPKPAAAEPAIEPESFEALAQRLATRVAEILLDKWLK